MRMSLAVMRSLVGWAAILTVAMTVMPLLVRAGEPDAHQAAGYVDGHSAAAGQKHDGAAKYDAAAKHAGHDVSVYVFNADGKLVGPVDSPKVVLSAAQWRRQLTAEQYHVLRAKDTETPFCGNLVDNKKDGVYTCAGCGLPLFSSTAKFDSGTGWPSFLHPVAKENVETQSRHERWHAAGGSEMRALQGASGARVRRWAGTARLAVLHEFGILELHRHAPPGQPGRSGGREAR